jgi:hypothetical protein
MRTDEQASTTNPEQSKSPDAPSLKDAYPAAPSILVTIFRDKWAKTAKEKSLTLEGLRDLIASTAAATKEDLPWLKLARFGTKRSKGDSLRNNDNVVEITGIEGDHDSGEMTFEEAVRRVRDNGLCAILYTSASHAPDRPRWRVLMIASKPLLPDKRHRLMARANGIFTGTLAAESFTLSQAYHYGRVDGNPHFKIEVIDGDFIDCRGDLDANLVGKGGNLFTAYGEQHLHEPARERLARMEFEDKHRPIHLEQLGASASLLNDGLPVSEVKQIVLNATKDAAERAKEKNWNWDEEDEKIEKMCTDWLRKHPELKPRTPDDWPEPVDLWGKFDPPELPSNLLPPVIEKFARIEGRMMGADPAGIAMAALCVCAAAIPDSIKIQPKRYVDFWTESARLWVAVVGDPSTMKTPIINLAAWPVKRIDAKLFQAFLREKEQYDALPAEERRQAPPPKQVRVRIEDITVEAAQEVLKDSPDGVLCLQDELSGWFGMMDKYSGNRGGMKDRSFYLQAWNGGQYVVNRVSRGAVMIPNLSMSVLGGIQPEPLRKLASESVDDGLLQRTCPVVLRAAVSGRDEPADPINAEYGNLIDALHCTKLPEVGSDGNFFLQSAVLRFDDGAQAIRADLEKKHLELQSFEAVSKKLSAHVGKYNGILARLCVIFHCIEHAGRPLPIEVTEDTARRAADFLHKFMLPHAVAFYAGVLGLSDDHEQLTAVAGYILAHKLEKFTRRDFQRSVTTMRGLGGKDIDKVLDQMDALGWLSRGVSRRPTDLPPWHVNPRCHELFRGRANQEVKRRAAAKKLLTTRVGKRHEENEAS